MLYIRFHQLWSSDPPLLKGENRFSFGKTLERLALPQEFVALCMLANLALNMMF